MTFRLYCTEHYFLPRGEFETREDAEAHLQHRRETADPRGCDFMQVEVMTTEEAKEAWERDTGVRYVD